MPSLHGSVWDTASYSLYSLPMTLFKERGKSTLWNIAPWILLLLLLVLQRLPANATASLVSGESNRAYVNVKGPLKRCFDPPCDEEFRTDFLRDERKSTHRIWERSPALQMHYNWKSDEIEIFLQNMVWNQTLAGNFTPTHDTQLLWIGPSMFSVRCHAEKISIQARTLDFKCSFPYDNIMPGTYKVEAFTLLSPDDKMPLNSDVGASTFRGYGGIFIHQFLSEKGCTAKVSEKHVLFLCEKSGLNKNVSVPAKSIEVNCTAVDILNKHIGYDSSEGYWTKCTSRDRDCLRCGWKWIPKYKCSLPLIDIRRFSNQKPVRLLIAGNSDSRGAFMAAIDLFHKDDPKWHIESVKVLEPISHSRSLQSARFGHFRIDKLDFRIDRAFTNSSEYIPGVQMSVNSATYFNQSRSAMRHLGKNYDVVFVNIHRWLGESPMIEFLSWFPPKWSGTLILGIHMPGTTIYRFDHCVDGEEKLSKWLSRGMPGARQDIHVDAIYYAHMSEPLVARMETPFNSIHGSQHNFRRCSPLTRNETGAWLCSPKCEVQLQLLLHKVINVVNIPYRDVSANTNIIGLSSKDAVLCESEDYEEKTIVNGILHVNATVVDVNKVKLKCVQ